MKYDNIFLFVLFLSLTFTTISLGQLPPVRVDHDGEVIALDRKAWSNNVDDVSESYQFNFEIPSVPPFECVKIDRVEFSVSASIDFDNSGGCFSEFWTHVLNCSIHDPISCDTDPFNCCDVDDRGINNWIVTNEDEDLFNGQILGFDVVAVSGGPPCSKDLISQGLFSASVSVEMEVYYIPDLPEEEIDLDDDLFICPGETIDLEGPDGFEIYEWDGEIDSDERILVDAIPGEYTLIVTDDRGCTSTDDIEIIEDGGFIVTFDASNPLLVCNNDSGETLQALVNNSIQTNDYSYQWTTPSGTSTDDNVTITDSGVYMVEVTDEDTECVISETIDVMTAQLSNAQIDSISMDVINSCETVYSAEAFIPVSDSNIYIYEWITGTDTLRTQTIDITNSGTYILNVLNEIGCPTTSDTVIVNLTPPAGAGQDNIANECNNQIIDLNVYLSNDASNGGTWENITGAGSLSGSQFNPMLLEGIFEFNYVVNNPPPCDNDTSIVTLTINPTYATIIDDELCEGDSIIVNNVVYDFANRNGEERMLTINGCDSIVTIDLRFVDEITETITRELCADDSIRINGVTYDFDNPIGRDTLTSFAGCDSIITIDLTFVDEKDSLIQQGLCAGDSIIINNITYNFNNQSGRDTLISFAGCDSIIVVDLTFTNEIIGPTIMDNLCATDSMVINGITYDINNQSGRDTLVSFAGCDSIIVVDLTFTNEIIGPTIMDNLCATDSMIINGITYDINNQSGSDTLTSFNGCDSIVFIDFFFYPENAIVEEMVLFCDSIFVVDEWIFQAGIIIDTLADMNGCDSIINTIVELDNCLMSINALPADLTCFESNDGSILIEVIGEYEYPLDYSIILNSDLIEQNTLEQEGDIFLNPLSAGDYNILIFDNTGTEIYNQNIAIISPPEIVVTLIEEVRIDCNSDMTAEISSQITGSSMGPFNYEWSDLSTNSTLSDVGAGNYSLIVEDSNNCTGTNSIEITEPDPLTADVNATNITCNSNDGGIINITNIAGGVEPYLTSLDGTAFDDVIMYNNLDAGSYEVSVQDANGCTYSETVVIITESSFTISPIDTIRIEEGASVEIDLNLDFIPQSISWSPSEGLSCNDCESPIATPLSDITYTVSVIDEIGCEIITEINIVVTPNEILPEPTSVYIPNTFSTRITDGINDVFKPLTSTDAELVVESFIIYDRWGNIVHEESGIIQGWDGFINDSESASGVYVYILNYNFQGNEEQRVGTVTLVD